MANEKRLIDANALWTALDEAGLFASGNPRHIAQQTVEEQPTVDAVEVVHGKWVKSNHRWKKTYKCSVCDNGAFDGNFVHGARHCPVCGAKMNLEAT